MAQCTHLVHDGSRDAVLVEIERLRDLRSDRNVATTLLVSEDHELLCEIVDYLVDMGYGWRSEKPSHVCLECEYEFPLTSTSARGLKGNFLHTVRTSLDMVTPTTLLSPEYAYADVILVTGTCHRELTFTPIHEHVTVFYNENLEIDAQAFADTLRIRQEHSRALLAQAVAAMQLDAGYEQRCVTDHHCARKAFEHGVQALRIEEHAVATTQTPP